MKKVLCVISHTHWDREWYLTFEEFRLKLVDLIDRLLKIIEKYPNYIFHLDAQTVVLEDYLEIRTENRAILEKHIKNGNIIVGPWYLQNDFYLTSGEATIRNLLEGRKIANSFGACSNVGYAPDQFGNISQLPQILNNFGIDNFVFGRGYYKYEKDENGKVVLAHSPLEFIWEGPDGSKLLAVNLRMWYNNAQRISPEVEKAKRLVDIICQDFDDKVSTQYYLLMNGVDHLEAQDDLPEAIDNFNAQYSNGEMKQYTLDNYISDVKDSLNASGNKLTVHKGELRCGQDGNILSGTLSSRHYIKVANVKAQNMLEQRLEPLYTMLEMSGCKGVYSYDHFRYMWKRLMQNHPHDTICGCSCDGVHTHSADNFARLSEVTNQMLERGLTELTYHTEVAQNAGDAKYLINVVNTTATEQSGITCVKMDLLTEDNITGFDIVDADNNPADFVIADKKEKIMRDVMSPLNLPGSLEVTRYTVYLSVGTVLPFSSKVFKVVAKPQENSIVKNNKNAVLENEFYKLSVSKSGAIDLIDKKNALTFKDVLYLEDTADIGDSYCFKSAGDTAITSKKFKPSIEVLENNSFVGKIKITWNMALPVCYDFQNKRRSKKTAISPVCLTLQLNAGNPTVKVDYEVDNHCKDHRLRLVVASDINNPKCFADTPFDLIERNKPFYNLADALDEFPNTSFAALQGDDKGIAALTLGAHETQHKNENELYLTILRATGAIAEWAPGEMWVAPENQVLRKTEGSIALVSFTGSVTTAQIPSYVNIFRTPLCSICLPTDRRRFAGGRPGVQDTLLKEFFYLPDYWPDALLKDNKSVVSVIGKTAYVTALKLSEDKNAKILRFYNYGTRKETVTVNVNGSVYLTDMAESSRELLGENKVKIAVKPKEIITLYII